jgi:hypothetical protein
MKTKELIKLLQEADPEGESHIRMSGGVPYFAEHKPGYYDGPYEYIDENGNWVYSTQGSKVDLYCKDMFDFIENEFYLHDPQKNNWDYIKTFFKTDLTYLNPDDRIEGFYKRAKQEFDEVFEVENSIYQRHLEQLKDNARLGWRWFRSKEKLGEYKTYDWIILDEKEEHQHASRANFEGVYYSDEWTIVDNNEKKNYVEYIFNNK